MGGFFGKTNSLKAGIKFGIRSGKSRLRETVMQIEKALMCFKSILEISHFDYS